MSDDNGDFKRGRRKRAASRQVAGDRLPPHNIEAEAGVVSCIMRAPHDSIVLCQQSIQSIDVFYDLRHQIVYKELCAMLDELVAVDIITLQSRLHDRQMLEQVGGIPFLSVLEDKATSPANLSYYLTIVMEKWKLRKIIQTCSDIVGRAYDFDGDANTLMDEVERDVLLINQEQQTDSKSAKELVNSAIASIERKFESKGAITGLSTGFTDLDRMTDGLHAGEMIVLAARPSMGKTSLSMQIAEHACLDLGAPVGVFSLEMTAESLMERAMCSRARVNLRDINQGFIKETDFPKLISVAAKFKDAPIYIDDTPGLSIIAMRARARRLWQQHGLKLLVVDYLQLLHSTTTRAEDNRQQEIADISSGLKALAKELKIPIVVATQLNRELEKRQNRKPRMSDLRESGAIEQDADVIGLLYKPGVTNAEQDEEAAEDCDGVAVNLLIAKQRNGPAGVDVNFTFLKPYTRFESASKVSDADVPNK